jgi:twitching motility protein PilJ
MPPGTDSKYTQLYGQAYAAYCKGDYETALAIAEQLFVDHADNGNLLLLRGHVYSQLQRFYEARQTYESVLRVTENQELVSHAQQGLNHLEQLLSQAEDREMGMAQTEGITIGELSFEPREDFAEDEDLYQEDASESHWQADDIDWDSGVFSDDGLNEPTIGKANLFRGETSFLPSSVPLEDNPFAQDLTDEDFDWQGMANGEAGAGMNFEQGDATFVVSSDLRGNPINTNSRSGNSRTPTRTRRLEEIDEYSLNESESFLLHNLSQSQDMSSSALSNSTFYGDEPDSGLNSGFNPKSNRKQTLTYFTSGDDSLMNPGGEVLVKPTVDVPLGMMATFINSPLNKKHWLTAVASGLVPPLVIFFISGISWLSSLGAKTNKPLPTKQKTERVVKTRAVLAPWSREMLLMSLFSGVGTFGVSWLLSGATKNTVKQTAYDLNEQFETMKKGNLNVRAKIYSEDELGQLAAQFNEMSRIIATITSSAQHRAAETEQAQEDLQRQVIRLLDDVEGAARGDLTVEAEVTADVLGAVADAFNSTIQNLREIVSQVKKSSEQVYQGSNDSESFARKQSKNALKTAEDLAATLNSVQMITESIQRVAENAHEAEEVARTSSITALKGGEAVETTVAGILQIRETVSETARKVKRLAEASQEISKIVSLISQIASRTNLLALNASIQAARAGEAGRGFAIVADEVRQLADRSARSLKEIEQIVLQIQSETGSVMTAMEEGIQQVIAVTEQSEQAKKSLEDIIQVANRIDTLVRSISADTVKQQENSRDVTQVMESVELKAQETANESQRVAGSLQNLVGISRNLLDSVERFKIDGEG